MKKLISFLLCLTLLFAVVPTYVFASAYEAPPIETVTEKLADGNGTLVYDSDFEGMTMTPAGAEGEVNTVINFSGCSETNGAYFSARTVRDFWVNDGYRNIYTDGHSIIWKAHDKAFTSPNGTNRDDNNNFELTPKNQPAGEDFVISFDVTLLAYGLSNDLSCFIYANNATSQIKSTPITIKKNGVIMAGSTELIKLSKGDSASIAIHVRIVAPDAAVDGDKGSVLYDVYLDGKLAAKDLYFLSKADQAKISKVDRNNSAVADPSNNTGLATDYKLTYTRFLHTNGVIFATDESGNSLGANGADLVSLDAVRMYYSDECYETTSAVKSTSLDIVNGGYKMIYTLDLDGTVDTDSDATIRVTSPNGTVAEKKLSELTASGDGSYAFEVNVKSDDLGIYTLEILDVSGAAISFYQNGKLTVKHEISTEGMREELESFDATIMPVYGARKAIVSLTFDDAVYPSALVVEEMCEKYGMKASMMMWCTRIGASGSDYADAETWAELFAKGYLEPQSHSWSHMNLRTNNDEGIANQTEANFNEQIVYSKTYLEELFPEYDYLTYAIPFGSMSDEAMDVALKTYYVSRGVSSGAVQSLDPTFGKSNGSWGKIYGPTVIKKDANGNVVDEATQIAYLEDWIDRVVNERGWYAPFIHKVGDVSGTEMTYNVIDAYFAYIDKYQESGDIWVTTFSEATKYVRERQNTTASLRFDGSDLYLTLTLAEKTEDDLPLPTDVFDHPLTVKVEVPQGFKQIGYTIDGEYRLVDTFKEGKKTYAYVDAVPNGEEITLDGDHTEHVWQSFEKLDDESHACVCPCGSTKLEPHNWNEGEIITEATHTKTGEALYTCVDCKETLTDTIEKTPEHTFDKQNTAPKYLFSAASCTSKAVYYYSCECGQKSTETFEYGDEPKGHGFDEWYTVNKMTVSSPAEMERECSVCEETETKYVYPLTPGQIICVVGDTVLGYKGATKLILSVFMAKEDAPAPEYNDPNQL